MVSQCFWADPSLSPPSTAFFRLPLRLARLATHHAHAGGTRQSSHNTGAAGRGLAQSGFYEIAFATLAATVVPCDLTYYIEVRPGENAIEFIAVVAAFPKSRLFRDTGLNDQGDYSYVRIPAVNPADRRMLRIAPQRTLPVGSGTGWVENPISGIHVKVYGVVSL